MFEARLATRRCQEDTRSDYVTVTSEHVTDDHVTSGRRMCGANAQYSDTHMEQIRSVSGSLYVEFRSNDVFDATGFEATYQFYSLSTGRRLQQSLSTPENALLIRMPPPGQVQRVRLCTL